MLRAAAAGYTSFFRLPDVARLFAMAVIARMPIGTISLSIAQKSEQSVLRLF